jgi:2-methylcitrate dehydratase
VDLQPARYRLPIVALRHFPVQIELQAVAEAGVRLSSRIASKVPDIREIRVQTYPGVIERVADAAKFRPEADGRANRSLPVCLAMALLDGSVNVAQYEAERWRRPDVMGLVARTVVMPSGELMARRPMGRGCTIEVLFNDGSMERETVEVAEGDTERPFSSSSLVQKFMSSASAVVGDAQALQIAATVENLENLSSMEELTTLLRPRLD